MRGMKTLGVRLDRQQSNALAIARWLKQHPRVRFVSYPGLEEHPHHELINRQSQGCGAMIAFEVTSHDLVEQLLLKTELISFAESLGGVETLITFPEAQTHADIPAEVRARLGINNVLLRLSVGIENVEDLIADLEQAFRSEGENHMKFGTQLIHGGPNHDPLTGGAGSTGIPDINLPAKFL